MRSIYLTGFMGSGKSVVGSRLAASLRVHFVDLDREIVRRTGKEIPVIFAEGGEEAFRLAEEEALRETSAFHEAVIAVGGGALANSGSMKFAREHGLVVYLRASPEELADRLMHGQAGRPMLRGEGGTPLDRQALLSRISNLLDAREPIYARADLTIDTDGRSIGQIVDAITGSGLVL